MSHRTNFFFAFWYKNSLKPVDNRLQRKLLLLLLHGDEAALVVLGDRRRRKRRKNAMHPHTLDTSRPSLLLILAAKHRWVGQSVWSTLWSSAAAKPAFTPHLLRGLIIWKNSAAAAASSSELIQFSFSMTAISRALIISDDTGHSLSPTFWMKSFRSFFSLDKNSQ